MEPRLVTFKEELMKSVDAIAAQVLEKKCKRETESNTPNAP